MNNQPQEMDHRDYEVQELIDAALDRNGRIAHIWTTDNDPATRRLIANISANLMTKLDTDPTGKVDVLGTVAAAVALGMEAQRKNWRNIFIRRQRR